MATIATAYSTLLTDLGNGAHHFASDQINVALLKTTYTANFDTNAVWNDVSSNEITGDGYTAGGKQLTAVTFVYQTNKAVLSANSLTWTGLDAAFRYALIYNVANAKLIGLIDFGEERTYAAEDFQLTFPNGVVAIQRPA